MCPCSVQLLLESPSASGAGVTSKESEVVSEDIVNELSERGNERGGVGVGTEGEKKKRDRRTKKPERGRELEAARRADFGIAPANSEPREETD